MASYPTVERCCWATARIRASIAGSRVRLISIPYSIVTLTTANEGSRAVRIESEDTPGADLEELLARVRALVVVLGRSRDDGAPSLCARLKDSVVRPLVTGVEPSDVAGSPDVASTQRAAERADDVGD